MLKQGLAALCLCCSVLPALAQTVPDPAQPAAQQAEAPQVPAEPIVVTGQRPGPGLWKVSRGDHVMWVFGTFSPLPKNLEWRSQEVETILAQSQEFLFAPSTSAQVGFFRGLTLLPYAVGLKKNPNDATLRDVLPAEVYARWLPLKAKYIGDDSGIERERPIFAAETLVTKGLAQAGLSGGGEVLRAIEQIARKNKVKMTSSNVALEVESPVQMLKDFKKAQLDDVACFTKTLELLETDIDAMRGRANAWAKGDVKVIEALGYADRGSACSGAIINSAFVQSQPGLQSVHERMKQAWLASAEKSLAANSSTFAVLSIKDILDPQGLLAALQAKGYQVDKPE